MNPFPVDYLFITGDHLLSMDGRITAMGASARLGSLLPTRALTDLGYDARTLSIHSAEDLVAAALHNAKRIVFGEMLPGCEDAYRRLLGGLTTPQERVIFSIAGDNFRSPAAHAFYSEALPRCLAVATVSEELAQLARRYTSRPVLLAPEPYEGARAAPHAVAVRRPSRALDWLARRIGVSSDIWRARLLWFGYPSSLPPLLELIPRLEQLADEYPLQLNIVSNPAPELHALLTPGRAAFRVQFTRWSPGVLDPILAYSDLVLVPSEYRNPARQAKSAHRLVAALHAGRFVVANPLPAYAPYADFAWLGEDLGEGLRWAFTHPEEVIARITRGQKYVDERHSPEVVARFWLDVFDLGKK